MDNCNASIFFFLRKEDQKGIKEQWAEPVTGSSSKVALGVKNLDTKSTFSPAAVTITPPVPKSILSKVFLSIMIFLTSSSLLYTRTKSLDFRTSLGLIFNDCFKFNGRFDFDGIRDGKSKKYLFFETSTFTLPRAGSHLAPGLHSTPGRLTAALVPGRILRCLQPEALG